MKFLRWLLRKWLPVAQAIGNFQAQVILTFFYVVVVAPLGIFYKFFSDPLRLRKRQNARTNFQKWQHPKETLETARKQY